MFLKKLNACKIWKDFSAHKYDSALLWKKKIPMMYNLFLLGKIKAMKSVPQNHKIKL